MFYVLLFLPAVPTFRNIRVDLKKIGIQLKTKQHMEEYFIWSGIHHIKSDTDGNDGKDDWLGNIGLPSQSQRHAGGLQQSSSNRSGWQQLCNAKGFRMKLEAETFHSSQYVGGNIPQLLQENDMGFPVRCQTCQ